MPAGLSEAPVHRAGQCPAGCVPAGQADDVVAARAAGAAAGVRCEVAELGGTGSGRAR
ncbi:hypothetical protein ACWCPT_32360 [Streptomyces sp. NPDC002308]